MIHMKPRPGGSQGARGLWVYSGLNGPNDNQNRATRQFYRSQHLAGGPGYKRFLERLRVGTGLQTC